MAKFASGKQLDSVVSRRQFETFAVENFCSKGVKSPLEVGDNCLRRLFNHTSFLTAWVWHIYLVLQLESTMISWRFDDQLIAPLPKLKTNPEVERLVSWSPTQSASVYPVTAISGAFKGSCKSKVPLIIQEIRFTSCQCELFSLEKNRLITKTANARSGLVFSIIYINNSTKDW